MVVVSRMLHVMPHALRKRLEANHPTKLHAQAKKPERKTHKRPVLGNGYKRKAPASEPGKPHGKSGMRVPSMFRAQPREVFAESKKKGGWGGSNPCKPLAK